MALWTWNQEAKRYIVTSEGAGILGKKAGTFVSVDDLTGAREKFIDYQKRQAQSLIDDLLSEKIDITQWTLQMREQIKQSHLAQYMLAKGGKNQMTQSDYGWLGNALRNQYQYLNGFANDILSGDLSDAQIQARANMYFNGSNASFERGKAASYGDLRLPAYPGDGSRTQCLSNCKCSWHIEDMPGAWWAYWRLSPAEHCADCIELSSTWNPLVISKI